MMTSEQIQQLRRDEAAMMAEWSASSVQPCCFNTDGIVDYECWAALPDGKHIVVLLKETNALSGSLVEFLSHGGSETYYRTWNNVARWANMILNGSYWEFVPKSALDDMVRNIAVINLLFRKRNTRCEYAASESSGQVLDIRAGKDSASDRTIIIKDCKKHISRIAINSITVPNAKKRSSQPRRLRDRRKGPKPGKEGFFAPLYFV